MGSIVTIYKAFFTYFVLYFFLIKNVGQKTFFT